MRVVKFDIGDRVIAIVNGEMLKGTIKSLYTDMVEPQAIVKFDDGTTAKRHLKDLAVESKAEPKAESEDVKAESDKDDDTISDDKAITITYGEFRNLTVETAVDIAKGNFKVGLIMTHFSAIIAEKLFGSESDND